MKTKNPKNVYIDSDMTFEDVGIFIKKLRKEEKMTREELAKKADITARTIYNIENGVYVPRIPVLARVARALDMNILELYGASRLYYEALATS